MQLPENMIACTSLEIAKDIPKELTFFKNQYYHLKKMNGHYQKALIAVGTGIGLYIILKTINYYANKQHVSQSTSEEKETTNRFHQKNSY